MPDKNLDVNHLGSGSDDAESSAANVNEDPKIDPQKSVSEDAGLAPERTEPSGSRTPEPNLKAALDEERRLRKEATARAKVLEDQLKQFNSSTVDAEDTEVVSDEGKALNQQIRTLGTQLRVLQEDKDFVEAVAQFPALKERANEFKEFRNSEYPGLKMSSVAKIYLAENDLLADQPRKGLEKPTSGNRQTINPKISVSEAENLMKNNFKLYQRMVLDGRIRPEDFK